ncbi:esterase/lipase family protein [Agromyces italicus]|uniref:esterase/lipase family protein n=1 Tax=Agromyces italicus TaxID=279572 RepID=UPI0003B32010|nr:alpha/beta hydrolase [Agromyces italicus]
MAISVAHVRGYLRWSLLDYLDAAGRQLRVLTRPKPPASWSRGDLSKPTIVLMPGVYEHWSFMSSIGDTLNAAGHRVRVVHGLGANIAHIPETAARVERALGRVPTPAAGQVVVAHSKGGLTGKWMLMREDAEALGLLGLVAIATPFNGSSLAAYMVDPSLREFDPVGPVIGHLTGGASANSRIVSVYPAFDPHVPEGSELVGAVNECVPVAGHFRVLGAPQTAAAVIAGIAHLAAQAA